MVFYFFHWGVKTSLEVFNYKMEERFKFNAKGPFYVPPKEKMLKAVERLYNFITSREPDRYDPDYRDRCTFLFLHVVNALKAIADDMRDIAHYPYSIEVKYIFDPIPGISPPGEPFYFAPPPSPPPPPPPPRNRKTRRDSLPKRTKNAEQKYMHTYRAGFFDDTFVPDEDAVVRHY